MRRRRYTSLIVILVIAFAALVGTLAAGQRPQLGLDLQGGASVVLQPPPGTASAALDQAIEIIRSRVDALGVAEPDIVRQGNTVLVELPGVKDQQSALDIVGQTAELRFRPVLNIIAPENAKPTTTTTAKPKASTTTTTVKGQASSSTASTASTASTTTTTAASTTTTTVKGQASSSTASTASTTTTTAASTTTTTAPKIPSTSREANVPSAQVILPDKDGTRRYVLGPTTVLGKSVSTASAVFDQVQWTVHLEMTG
ncbi:MAG: preprotein translocase subunit SecD, partial [Actinomycetota bacterium]|nr:preprotein translocase subunit SecD [Actinomycetota bacterium]